MLSGYVLSFSGLCSCDKCVQHAAWDYIFFLKKILGSSISQCEIPLNRPSLIGAILTEQKMKAVLLPQQARTRWEATPEVPCKLSTYPKASGPRIQGITFQRPLTPSEHKSVWPHWAAGAVTCGQLSPTTLLKAKTEFRASGLVGMKPMTMPVCTCSSYSCIPQ